MIFLFRMLVVVFHILCLFGMIGAIGLIVSGGPAFAAVGALVTWVVLGLVFREISKALERSDLRKTMKARLTTSE